MGDEHEVTLKDEQLSTESQKPSGAETMRRCRSLNELPGYHRVTVLKRQDTERTRARFEAAAAGMEELKTLREKHQLLMEETLCESVRKQQSVQRSEVEYRPHRSQHEEVNRGGIQQQQQESSQRTNTRERNMIQNMNKGKTPQHIVHSEGTVSHNNVNMSLVIDYLERNMSQRQRYHDKNASKSAVNNERNVAKCLEKNVGKLSQNDENLQAHHTVGHGRNVSQRRGNHEVNMSQSEDDRYKYMSHRTGQRKENVSDFHMKQSKSETNQVSLSQKQIIPQSFPFQISFEKSQSCVTEQSKILHGSFSTKCQSDQRHGTYPSRNSERNQNPTHIQTQTRLNYWPRKDHGPAAMPEDLRQRDTLLGKDHKRLSERSNKDQRRSYSAVQENVLTGSARPVEDERLRQTGTSDKYTAAPSVQIHSRNSHTMLKQENTNINFPGELTPNTAQLRESKSVTSLYSAPNAEKSSVRRHPTSVANSVTENHLKLENRRGGHLESRNNREFPVDDHSDQRHSRVLIQSDQRFSRGRTQSVHENFYYFPQKEKSGRNSFHDGVNGDNDPAVHHIKYADKTSSSRSQNNCQTDVSKLSKSQTNETPPTSTLQPPPQNKSISWEELLVTVGLGKMDSHNDSASTRMLNNDENFQNQSDTPRRCGREQSHISTTDDKLHANVDKQNHLPQDVSQKPCRSQSFSSSSGYCYDSLTRHGGNVLQNSLAIKPQRAMSSADIKSALYSGISRHHSLYFVNSRQPIFNPLHEVDIRSMDRPGPLHAVTLQYAGLSTRNVSMSTISPASSMSSVTAGVNSSSDKSPLSVAPPTRTGPPTSTEMNRLCLSTVEYSPDNTVSCSSSKTSSHENIRNSLVSSTSRGVIGERSHTGASAPSNNIFVCQSDTLTRPHSSLYSPKTPLIKTIDEDSEDVFEYSFEWSHTPTVKPRSYSDTFGRSRDFNDDTSTRFTPTARLNNVSRHINTQSSSNKEITNDSSQTELTTQDLCQHESDTKKSSRCHSENKNSCPNSNGNSNDSTTNKYSYSSSAKSKSQEVLFKNSQPSPPHFSLSASDVTQAMDEGYITCDSASHKVPTDISSDSSDSVCNLSAFGGGGDSNSAINITDSVGNQDNVDCDDIITATCMSLSQNSSLKCDTPTEISNPNKSIEKCRNCAGPVFEKNDMMSSMVLKNSPDNVLSGTQLDVSLATSNPPSKSDKCVLTDTRTLDSCKDIQDDVLSGNDQTFNSDATCKSNSRGKKPFKQTDL